MNGTKAPRVCFYARCSISSDVAARIEYQVAFAERWCADQGMVLVDIVAEDRIGPQAFDRPRFKGMLADALGRHPSFDVILVHSPCRISRHPHRLAVIIERLRRANVRVETISGKIPLI